MLVVAGCATMWRGHSETIAIESEPVGALVRLGNGFTGRTPASFVVPRKGDLQVTVTKEGYEPITIVLRPTLGGGAIISSTTGNTAAAIGTGAVIGSTLVVEGGAMTASTAAAVATPLAAVAGVVLIGGVAIDLNSGAMLSHASGPVRFVLMPKIPSTPP